MVDWKSPVVAKAALEAFIKLAHVFTGIYIWELVTSMTLEWEFITRKREFKWPLAFYFLNRYSMFAALIATIITFDGNPSNCRAAMSALLFFAHMALALASANLAIRTTAIWAGNNAVILILTLLMCVHSGLVIFQAATAHVQFFPGIGCAPSSINYAWDVAIYAFALAFDFFVLSLNVWKLRSHLHSKSASLLTTFVFKQGIAYFLAACLVDLVAIIFLVLDLNIGTIAISTQFAALVCTIVACRAVRSLSGLYKDGNSEMTNMATANAPGRRTTTISSVSKGPTFDLVGTRGDINGQVLVEMETVIRRDSYTHDRDSDSKKQSDFNDSLAV
ncbi:hypothetical protein CPB83DRAFT_861960 [Crepidotus variabilis]|uniref:Transmembrane protein n=1 Tax=Crepidotus variabilis TaxID=179855 RepID=A0A9P6E7P0_9AGAR|nr:hypothetical protein CPB83DRAFT_861960 [Crepidotus variabilis]